MKRFSLHLTSGLLAASVGFSVAAQRYSPSVTQCLNERKAFSVDVQISGCTAALQSTQDTPIPLLRALIYVGRGDAYRAAGAYDRAIADFGEALSLNAEISNTLAYFSRGEVYAEKKNYDRAIADYSEALKGEPKLVRAYFKRARAYTEKKDYDLAIADYSELIKLHPSFAEAYRNRSIAYWRKGDYAPAIADFFRALFTKSNHQNSREALERLGAKP